MTVENAVEDGSPTGLQHVTTFRGRCSWGCPGALDELLAGSR